MPEYTVLTAFAVVAVVVAELVYFKSGIFTTAQYWWSIVIIFAFQVLVDGWLTKLSAPIVIYRSSDTSDIYPIWNILVEEYVYAFALLTLTMACWDWLGRRERVDSGTHQDPAESSTAGVGS